MSRLHYNLGYGKQADIELDTFTRILTDQIYDTEEIRCLKPIIYNTCFEYVGIAEKGSSIYDPVWNCVRCTWINGKKTRYQFQENIIWNNVDQGWPN